MILGSSRAAAPSGTSDRWMKAPTKRAPSAAMHRSAPSASVSPIPAQAPCTAATTGTRQLMTARAKPIGRARHVLLHLDAVVLRGVGLEVGSRTEAPTVATDHDGACAALRRGVEAFDEQVPELGVDRVVAIGSVQGQPEHAVFQCRVKTHVADDSRGRPRMLSARMLRCTCDVPAYTVPLAAFSIHTCSHDAVEFGAPGSSVR